MADNKMTEGKRALTEAISYIENTFMLKGLITGKEIEEVLEERLAAVREVNKTVLEIGKATGMSEQAISVVYGQTKGDA